MKKKFMISLVAFLTSLSVCVSTTLNISYAMWPNCDKLNKDGQFDDVTCAITDSVNKINTGEKFIKLDNVGPDSEYSLLFFDSSEINSVLSNLTYNKNIKHAAIMKQYQLEKENEAISDKIYTFGIGGTSANILKNAFKALNLKREDGNRLLQNPLGELNLLRRRIQNVAVIVPLAIATGVSTLVAGLACTVNSYFSNKDINNFIMSAHVEKDNYFSFIKSIANHLEDGDLTINKILCLSTDHATNRVAIKILDKKISNNYSLDEQKQFDESIKNLKESINTILSNANE